MEDYWYYLHLSERVSDKKIFNLLMNFAESNTFIDLTEEVMDLKDIVNDLYLHLKDIQNISLVQIKRSINDIWDILKGLDSVYAKYNDFLKLQMKVNELSYKVEELPTKEYVDTHIVTLVDELTDKVKTVEERLTGQIINNTHRINQLTDKFTSLDQRILYLERTQPTPPTPTTSYTVTFNISPSLSNDYLLIIDEDTFVMDASETTVQKILTNTTHTIQVMAQGYNTYSTNITVNEDMTLNIVLQPIQSYSTVFNISPVPSSDYVFSVDSVEETISADTGTITKMLSTGQHTIIVRATGYNDYTETINVISAETHNITLEEQEEEPVFPPEPDDPDPVEVALTLVINNIPAGETCYISRNNGEVEEYDPNNNVYIVPYNEELSIRAMTTGELPFYGTTTTTPTSDGTVTINLVLYSNYNFNVWFVIDLEEEYRRCEVTADRGRDSVYFDYRNNNLWLARMMAYGKWDVVVTPRDERNYRTTHNDIMFLPGMGTEDNPIHLKLNGGYLENVLVRTLLDGVEEQAEIYFDNRMLGVSGYTMNVPFGQVPLEVHVSGRSPVTVNVDIDNRYLQQPLIINLTGADYELSVRTNHGCTVTVDNTVVPLAYRDSNYDYFITYKPNGTYNVTCSQAGYITETKQVTINNRRATKYFDLRQDLINIQIGYTKVGRASGTIKSSMGNLMKHIGIGEETDYLGTLQVPKGTTMHLISETDSEPGALVVVNVSENHTFTTNNEQYIFTIPIGTY